MIIQATTDNKQHNQSLFDALKILRKCPEYDKNTYAHAKTCETSWDKIQKQP